MMVGDRSRFAIEFDIDLEKANDSSLAPWLFGRVRWWLASEPVGLYEDDTSIRDMVVEAERFLTYSGGRLDAELSSASAEVVAHRIESALFDDHGQTPEQLAEDERRFRRLVVKPLMDTFDRWDMFLLETTNRGRLIWRDHANGVLRELELEAGEFDETLRGFLIAVRNPPASRSVPG